MHALTVDTRAVFCVCAWGGGGGGGIWPENETTMWHGAIVSASHFLRNRKRLY